MAALSGLAMTALLAGCSAGGLQADPVATPLSLEVNEDSAVTFTLSAARVGADSATFAIVDAPEHGTLSGTAPALTYTPDADFLGADSFTFTVAAGSRASAETTVNIDVLNTPFFAITRGSSGGAGPEDDVASRLYRVDARGRISLVGDTGHALTALSVDPSDGRLYATTSSSDLETAGCDSCLVSLDAATGAATVIGALDADSDPATVDGPVNGLVFTSDGSLYGYSIRLDELVGIDKATGVMTRSGASGIDAFSFGIWADADDRLWLMNGDGDVHTLDAATGVATLVHTAEEIAATAGYAYDGDFHVRGDRDPATGKYWGVSPGYGYNVAGGIARLAIDLESAVYIDNAFVETASTIHDIAFVRE